MADTKKNKFAFLTPEEYAIINDLHLKMNKDVVEEFKSDILGQPASPQDSKAQKKLQIIDFGCGTGETTKDLASGTLLPNVGFVTGLDLSQVMIDYCNRMHSKSNLEFKQFDISDMELRTEFEKVHQGKIDLVTSFSTMHWLPNQTDALKFFRSMLKPESGRLVLLVCCRHSQNNAAKLTFEKVKADYTVLMEGIQYKHNNFRYLDSDNWQTRTSEKGVILPEDYKKLVESCGFSCLHFAECPGVYHLKKNHHMEYIKNSLIPSYQEEFDNFEKFEAFKTAFIEEYLAKIDQKQEFHDVIFDNVKLVAKPAAPTTASP